MDTIRKNNTNPEDSSQKPLILDTTLRDGEQTPGLYFTDSEKSFIARELDELGVNIIEVGTPGMGSMEQNALKSILHMNLKAEIMTWNRLTKDDVKASLNTEIPFLHVSVPTSTQLLTGKLGKTPDWIFKQMDEVIGFAMTEGLNVSFGAEDSSRTDFDFLLSVYHHAQNLGVKRVRFADTLGILTPYETTSIIHKLSENLSVPIDFHGHNDTGLATANALCAWKSGATIISCTLLGLGERAGNTAMEEFIGCCHFLANQFPDYDFLRLRNVCETISYISERPFSPVKPFFGSEIFRHESGIHVDGLLKDFRNYESFSPETVGGERKIIIGKHSGRASLKYQARQYGNEISNEEAQYFLDEIHRIMTSKKNINVNNLFMGYLSNINNRSKAI